MWKSDSAGGSGCNIPKAKKSGPVAVRASLLSAAIAMATAFPALAEPGSWVVSEKTSPLTNSDIYSASLESTESLLNQINQPEKATLVLRCSERQPAFYVSWPQVIARQHESVLLNLPETLVLERIDDAPITADFWVISGDGAAAGSFDRIGAPRLISSISHARKLVVRITGTIQQDAVFDLTGVEDVVQTIGSKCGLPGAAKPIRAGAEPVVPAAAVHNASDGAWGPVAFGAPASTKSGKNQKESMATIKSMLEAGGWKIASDDEIGGRITTDFKDAKLNSDQVNFSVKLGIPYIFDNRAKTQVQLDFTVADDIVIERAGVRGYWKSGYGAPDKALTCTPKKPLATSPYVLGSGSSALGNMTQATSSR